MPYTLNVKYASFTASSSVRQYISSSSDIPEDLSQFNASSSDQKKFMMFQQLDAHSECFSRFMCITLKSGLLTYSTFPESTFR